MEAHLIWVIAGIILVIVELLTGTFYLLVLGVAAFAGAGVAWAGQDIWPQTICAAVVAAAGVAWVRHWRKGASKQQMPSLDVGQAVKFETWVSEAGRQARVRYRDTLWDAELREAGSAQPGDIFYIVAVHGHTLEIARTRS